MKTIIAAVDFSGVTDAVIAEATALARAVKSRVVVVSVMQRVVFVPPPNSGGYVPTTKTAEEITVAAEKTTARRLASIRARLQRARIASQTIQLTGVPVTEILAQARKHAADYIVMGSHGHTAVYELLVGSTTHGVLNRAKCPLVIVPANKKRPRTAGRRQGK